MLVYTTWYLQTVARAHFGLMTSPAASRDHRPRSELDLPAPEQSCWASIAHQIAQGIACGAYAPGSRLPSEQQLAERHGVNRHTVRRSLARLSQLGLVRPTRGSGTFVETFAVEAMLGQRPRHRQDLAQAGLKGALRAIAADTIEADTRVAEALEIAEGAPVLHLVVLGDGGGRTLHAGDRYFPLPRFGDFATHLAASGSITEAFRHYGVDDYTRRSSRISARLPTPVWAERLAQPSHRPALFVISINVDETGRPIEYARTWFAGDRVSLTWENTE